MDIRKKTVVIVGITLLCLILALYILSSVIVMGGFSRVESQSAQKDANLVLVTLGDEINTLDTATNDWASREDTRALIFANVSITRWSILGPEIFEGLGFNDILLSDAQGNPIAGQGYDLDTRTLVPVPEDLRTVLASESRRGYSGDTAGTMGIVMLPEGPMMIAIRPVFSDTGSGQILGYLMMGRYLDAREVSRITTMAQLPLEVYPYGNATLPPDVTRAVPGFEPSSVPFIVREGHDAIMLDAPTTISPIDSTTLGTYSLIRDIYGKPVIILRISIARDIYAQGTSTTLYFVILLIAAGLIFGLATVLLLEKIVLSRLARLSMRVNDIGRKRDFSARVEIRGQDEIGGLAGNVNGMLEDLEQSQNILHHRLIQSEEQYRLFFNSITDPVCVCRMNSDTVPGIIV